MKRRRDNLVGYIFTLPTIILFVGLTFIPFLYGVYMSFTKWDGFGEPQFIGVQNYITLFTDERVFQALSHNVIYALGTVTVKVIVGFAFALVLNKKLKGVNCFRSILFTPVVLSYIAIGMIWTWMLNPSQGLINNFLSFLGVVDLSNPIEWLGNPHLALFAVMFVDVWKWMGYHMVLFLAGLQTIPDDLYESARIDGASAWQRLRFITIPLMKSVVITNVMFCLTGAFGVFDIVMAMTDGGPYGSTEVISKYIYDTSFGATGKFGYAASISVFVFLIMMVATLIMVRMMRRAEEDS